MIKFILDCFAYARKDVLDLLAYARKDVLDLLAYARKDVEVLFGNNKAKSIFCRRSAAAERGRAE